MAVNRTNGGALPIGSVGKTLVTGRELSMYTVSLTNVHVGYANPNSDFEKLIRAIETVSSVELLGTPGAGAFRIAVTGLTGNTTIDTDTIQLACNTAVATTTAATYAF